MKTVLISAAALLLAPAVACAADLSGEWKLNVSIAGQTIPVACTFAQSGAALSGTCGGADGKPASLTGTSDGSKASWAYDTTYMDMPMHVVFAGDLTANGLSGTIEVPGASGTFTGAK